jgi:hypothetical protein
LKHPLKARANELDADDSFAVSQGFRHVNHTAARFEVLIPARRPTLHGNADLEIRTHGDIEARAKRGSATA